MESLWSFEINLIVWMQSLGTWLAQPFRGLSFLATENFFIILMPLMYWCIDAQLGFRMAMMMVFSESTNLSLKLLFHTPRPFWYDPRVNSLSQETSFGIPSGHSQNSFAIFGILAASLRKRWAYWVVGILLFLVGLSRLFLGMHFLHDVLIGWIVGLLLIVIYFLLEKPVSRWIKTKPLWVQVITCFAFSIAIILTGFACKAATAAWVMPGTWSETTLLTGGVAPDPINMESVFTIGGVAFGFLAGYAILFKQYGQPKVTGSAGKRLLRYVIGLVGVFAIYLGFKLIFPSEPLWIGYAFRFLRYTLLGLWVSWVAPLLFRKIKI